MTPGRWAAVGGLLAAAAAVLLWLPRDHGLVSNSGASATQDLASPDLASQDLPASTPAWVLDTSLGDEAELLASLRVDGQPLDSLDEFSARMATAQRVASVGQDLRIRHRDAFVLELGADSIVGLDAWSDRPTPGEAQMLHLELGSIRVATGPGFDRDTPLAVETPYVRTEVVGTVFGVDLGADYTCVCCLEGEVQTTLLAGERSVVAVGPKRTRFVSLEGGRLFPSDVPLIEDHRGPLERLVHYWG